MAVSGRALVLRPRLDSTPAAISKARPACPTIRLDSLLSHRAAESYYSPRLEFLLRLSWPHPWLLGPLPDDPQYVS